MSNATYPKTRRNASVCRASHEPQRSAKIHRHFLHTLFVPLDLRGAVHAHAPRAARGCRVAHPAHAPKREGHSTCHVISDRRRAPRRLPKPTMPTTSEETSSLAGTSVVVHPLVLLSVTDHASRVSIGSRKRVLGVLLGQDNGKVINVANSFAIPFEEDERDPKTWFLDHDYIEGMMEMFKKVNGTSPS